MPELLQERQQSASAPKGRGWRNRGILVLALWLALEVIATASPGESARRFEAIASAHPLATAAGMQILAQGGNAFDAAIAVSATLGVVEPYSSGIGGGGFWLLQPHGGQPMVLDGRETAPRAATADMYLDAHGQVIPGLSVNGALAAGIPGAPAAWVHLARYYGRLRLSQSLAPAIRLAQKGFKVDAVLSRHLEERKDVLLAAGEAGAVFLDHGKPLAPGAMLRQPHLARTLLRLALGGHRGFYEGPTAQALVEGIRAAGGIWTLADLEGYQAKERPALKACVAALCLLTTPPPSAGGLTLVETARILEQLGPLPPPGVQRVHLVVEAWRRAYRDRALYVGDPDFVDVPVAHLTDVEYARGLAATIKPDRATPSVDLGEGLEAPSGVHTSHYVILDREGNMVSATQTINTIFGSGLMPEGSGVLLNNEMDDFVAKPGSPNTYGLVGSSANAIAPGKRMVSSVAPTIAYMQGPAGIERTVLIGTPGGSRIPSMVFLGLMGFMDGQGAQDMVSMPRYHHQYLPDRIEYERGALDTTSLQVLESMGYALQEINPFGNMQAILFDGSWERPRNIQAASDPRGIGQAQVRQVSGLGVRAALASGAEKTTALP
jgi:gamma-glutamyltranspeptidase/glutathione hydrolase